MNFRYKITFCILLSLIFIFLFTPPIEHYKNLRTWVIIAPNFQKHFFSTKEARKIGNNCLIYQYYSGGFPKDYYYPDIMSKSLRKKILRDKNTKKNSYSTFDNDATTTEITYLSKLYKATNYTPYKDSAIKGIDFILNSQYESGGFPQQPMRRKDVSALQITYNDGAMINILKLLTKISEKSYPFEYIDDIRAEKAKIALKKGINCIIKTQIKQNGKLTGWCQQYNRNTLKPTEGRSFERISIDGGKISVQIVLYLMSLENPSQEIKNAIESSVQWFETSKIYNKKIKVFKDKNNNYDAKIIQCKSCPPIWAKNYDIETNKPFFVTRNSEKKYDLKDIPQERRIGYEWYGYYPQEVLDAYKTWKYRHNK